MMIIAGAIIFIAELRTQTRTLLKETISGVEPWAWVDHVDQ